MNDVTSLSDLQIDPIGGSSMGSNIAMTATEQYNPNIDAFPTTQSVPSKQEINTGGELDESTVHLLINGLQKAAMSGATKLPSRDIPMMPSQYMNDREINPHFIPEPTKRNYDYIQEEQEDNIPENDVIKNYKKKTKKTELMDDFYNEIQIPLLLSLLYFLLQLPFFKKWLFRYLPNLFLKDGNLNIYGYIFNSVLFGLTYYIVNKLSIISLRLGNF